MMNELLPNSINQPLQKAINDELTDQIIFALSNAVEAKDMYTNGHSQRVACYAREIVRRMGLDEAEQRQAYCSGMLHDVGKIHVADAIINKIGALTDTEYMEIKLHTLAGYYMIKEISAISDFAVGARWHHERYDGSGYPNGLAGKNIPFIARVLAVADSYDAMTSNRSYRNIMPQERVREELIKGTGIQFDPEIVSVMIPMIDEDTEYRMRQHSTQAGWNILAVDDEPVVLRLVEFTLSKNPLYRIIKANSAKEAMDILENQSIDLVLLDVEMPVIGGFELLDWIRQRRGSLPVIFMTGDKKIENIMRAESMGISDYLTKPIIARMLLDSIQSVLSTSRFIRQKIEFNEGMTK